jgi:hypothetical protein
MTNKDMRDTASISIEGSGVEDHWVTSDILGRVINGFQDAVWIVGFALENLSFEERFRLTNDLKKNYAVKWGISKPGSYVQPLRFPANPQTAVHTSEILAAISSENFEGFKKIMPDSRLRDKLYRAILNFLPRTGEGWQMKYQHRSSATLLDVKSYQKVLTWRSESLSHRPSDDILTIKGDLLRIDFEAKRVEVRYPPTKRPLKCYYLSEIEDSIVESRKDLIEVTGRFELDQEGYPERLAEVSNIQPVDLSEMVLPKNLEQTGRKLNLVHPMAFALRLDEETKQFYTIEDDSIGISVSAHTREELMKNLIEQLFFLWDTYGSDQVDTDLLTKGALNFRKELCKRFQET